MKCRRTLFGKQPLVAHVLAQAVANGAKAFLRKLCRCKRENGFIGNPGLFQHLFARHGIVLIGRGGAFRPTVHVFPHAVEELQALHIAFGQIGFVCLDNTIDKLQVHISCSLFLKCLDFRALTGVSIPKTRHWLFYSRNGTAAAPNRYDGCFREGRRSVTS